MVLLRTNYRKHQYLHSFIQTMTIVSDAVFANFSTGWYRAPRGGWRDEQIKIIPYGGDFANEGTIFDYAKDVSWSGNVFAVSLFFSRTSFAALPATVSGTFLIEVLITSR